MSESRPDVPMIDIDGHIYEPPDLWQRYVEPRYRESAIRVVRSQDGMNHWLVKDKPSQVFPVLMPLHSGLHDRLAELPSTARAREFLRLMQQDYLADSHPGAWEPQRRLEVMDRMGIEATLLFPTLGLSWEEDALDDPAYTYAHMRAYNTWISEFCSAAPSRLLPVIQLSLLDVPMALREIERTARLGARAAILRTVAVAGKEPSHPHFDPVWSALADHDLPLALHVLAPQRTLLNWGRYRRQSPFLKVFDSLPNLFAVVDLIMGGVFDRHPGLRLCCLEVGASWVPWLLANMDDKARSPVTRELSGHRLPSEVFREHCWVTPMPGEDLPVLWEAMGPRALMAYTDFPHPEVHADMIGLWQTHAATLAPDDTRRFFRSNALAFLGLSDGATRSQ